MLLKSGSEGLVSICYCQITMLRSSCAPAAFLQPAWASSSLWRRWRGETCRFNHRLHSKKDFSLFDVPFMVKTHHLDRRICCCYKCWRRVGEGCWETGTCSLKWCWSGQKLSSRQSSGTRPQSSPQRAVMTGAEGPAWEGPPLNTDVVLLPELLLL